MRNTNTDQPGHSGDVRVQEFLDMIAPSVIKFNTDHFICGNTFRCVWALREYPTSTEEQAILKRLGEKDGVTLRIYTRHVNAAEERKIISNAASKNRMERANTNDLQYGQPGMPHEKEKAVPLLEASAAQGNVYAQFLLENLDSFRDPDLVLAATRLMHHLSRIFQEDYRKVTA